MPRGRQGDVSAFHVSKTINHVVRASPRQRLQRTFGWRSCDLAMYCMNLKSSGISKSPSSSSSNLRATGSRSTRARRWIGYKQHPATTSTNYLGSHFLTSKRPSQQHVLPHWFQPVSTTPPSPSTPGRTKEARSATWSSRPSSDGHHGRRRQRSHPRPPSQPHTGHPGGGESFRDSEYLCAEARRQGCSRMVTKIQGSGYFVHVSSSSPDNLTAPLTDLDMRSSADDPSYQYCIAGRQVVRFEVMVYPKDQVCPRHLMADRLCSTLAEIRCYSCHTACSSTQTRSVLTTSPPSASCNLLTTSYQSAPPQGSSCPIDLILETSKGQAFQLLASAQTEKDLSKGAPVGSESFFPTLRVLAGRED